ncbi:MAG: hypothetical protein J0I69_14325 [Altererythrobacter sp.]|nr:hypothetical protein [Altererythrobacter sp.]
MKTLAIAIAAIAMTATGAAAAEPKADNEAKQEKKICKSEKMTGSLTRVRRTCLTQSEWDQLAENTRRNLDRIDADGNAKTRELMLKPVAGAGG